MQDNKTFDCEKLVLLVKNRPTIYNYKLREHSDKKCNELLWHEIAGEMKSSVHECKQKWGTLRNSYARVMRKSSNKSNRRKTWYLKNSMSFLELFMNCNKTVPENGANDKDTEMLTNNITADNFLIEPTPSEHDYDLFSKDDHVSQDSPSSQSFTSVSKKSEATNSINKEADPLGDNQWTDFKNGQEEIEDPNLSFLKSLLPDLNKLPDTRQRTFKLNLLNNLCKLLDEQENEALFKNTNNSTHAQPPFTIVNDPPFVIREARSLTLTGQSDAILQSPVIKLE